MPRVPIYEEPEQEQPFNWVNFWVFWMAMSILGALTCFTAAIWVDGPVCGKLGASGGILCGVAIIFAICAAVASDI